MGLGLVFCLYLYLCIWVMLTYGVLLDCVYISKSKKQDLTPLAQKHKNKKQDLTPNVKNCHSNVIISGLGKAKISGF